jgi:hypothetical protein
MTPLRLSCEGITLGETILPPFELRAGEGVCLHVPWDGFSREEDQLVRALTGKEAVRGLHLFGKIFRAVPAVSTRGLLGFFHQPRVVDWFRKAAGVTRAQARNVLTRLGIRAEGRISQLAGTPRTLLGLEAAWARCAEAIVFSTSGLDLCGRSDVLQAVSSHLDRCPAIYLSHWFWQGGQKKRECFPGATCVEITTRFAAPATSG